MLAWKNTIDGSKGEYVLIERNSYIWISNIQYVLCFFSGKETEIIGLCNYLLLALYTLVDKILY